MDADNRRLGRLLGGVGLIGIGALILVAQLLRVDVWSASWPFLFVALGLLMFIGMFAGGKQTAGMAIPGSILTVLGIIFFVQNLTGQWQSWAYAWTLLWPTAVGLGLLIQGLWGSQQKHVQEGWKLIRLGLILLLAGIAFFELILGIGGWGIAHGRLATYIAPILLIGFGVVMLFRSARAGRGDARPSTDTTDGSAPREE